MLTRSPNLAPQAEYYADSLLTLPTFTHSVFDNLAAGIATPIVAANMLNDQFAKTPDGQAMLSSLRQIQLEQNTPGMGWTQWLSGEGSNILGQALNPVTWALGEVGGLAAGGIVRGATALAGEAEGGAITSATAFMRKPLSAVLPEKIGKYVPEMIGKVGEEKTLSAGLISENSLKNFGTFAGAGLPQGIIDNRDNDTGNINWGGVARESGAMGAFGIAIGSIPFAFGILRGKINRGIGDDPSAEVGQTQLNKALEQGHITQAEHDWYKGYLEYQKDPGNKELGDKLKSDASGLINENGHTANTVSNEAMFDMLTPENMRNLQGVIADQLLGDVPENYRTALSDFVVHNSIDEMRSKPEMLDGVRGYVDFVDQKLKLREEKSTEADKILDDHMLKSVKENMPFSQKELFKHMKQVGFEASHIKHLPITIPQNLVARIAALDKIAKLRVKVRKDVRRGLPENKQTLRRIAELQNKLPKILTPKEELTQLRLNLLDGGLKKGFESYHDYHRLLDLANVWHNARTLADRVHLEHEYNKQQAFRDLSKNILNIADSDVGKISKPDDVVNYLKTRVEGQLRKVEPLVDIEKGLDKSREVPTDPLSVLNDQREQVNKINAEEAKAEFNGSLDKYREFTEKPSIFENLLACVRGSIGG